MNPPLFVKPSADHHRAMPARAWHVRWRWMLALAVLGLAAAAAAIGERQLHHARLEHRLLATLPDQVAADPRLIGFAITQARPLFAHNCAVCHGSDMRGNAAAGGPNLTDSVWLYGAGSIYDIERTILYGIRSGDSKARNVTDMPAFGLRGALTPAEIHNVVQYLLKLDHRPYVEEAADQGYRIYYNPRGDCADCHGADAKGDADYGAPDLTINVWNNGDDPQSLFRSIYFGRHRIMPAWIGLLSLEQIRALAVYIYAVSHAKPSPTPSPP